MKVRGSSCTVPLPCFHHGYAGSGVPLEDPQIQERSWGKSWRIGNKGCDPDMRFADTGTEVWARSSWTARPYNVLGERLCTWSQRTGVRPCAIKHTQGRCHSGCVTRKSENQRRHYEP
uniref:Uncharacterized protein n=1 Tax=Eutreptiella gymnastica TaxID=73025 RepID=A0A7S1N6B6_9EUGL